MKKRALVGLIIMVLMISMVTVVGENTVTCELVDYKISYWGGGNMQKEFDNPMISYNGRTYIAIRDMAKVLHRDVLWYDDSKVITIKGRKTADIHIEIETAYEILKALAQQYYGERITENSVDAITHWDVQNNYMDDMWAYHLIFEKPADRILNAGLYKEGVNDEDVVYVANNADVVIHISKYDGHLVDVTEIDENGKRTEIDVFNRNE